MISFKVIKIKPINCLIMCASKNVSTGYGIVGKHLFEGLKKYPNIYLYHLGLQNIGHQLEKGQLAMGWKTNASDVLSLYLKMYNIDVLITITDNWMPDFHYIQDTAEKMGVKYLCHVTINTVPCPFILYNAIYKADHFVAPSDFVKEQLVNIRLTNVTTIYHGIDTTIFKPKSIEKKNKEFTFLAVGVNKTEQKNWLGLLKAFKYLVYDLNVKDVRLFIHTETPNPPEGLDFDMAIEQAGLNGYVDVNYVIRNIGSTEERMSEIYNSCDAYVSASVGESFSCPLLESLACGLPAIVPDFSAMSELVKRSEAGYVAKLKTMLTLPVIAEQGLVDEIDLAEQMKKVKELSPEQREELSKHGVIFAKKYDWENVVKDWENLIKLVAEPKCDFVKDTTGL